MRTLTTNLILSSMLALGLAACGDDGGGIIDPPDAGPLVDAPANTGGGGECSDVFCADDIILDMSLHFDRTSDGDVTNIDDNGDWVSTIDATAGGFGQSDQHAFLYMKFTDTGLVKVDIDDETALDSTEWDIAARRYVVRLNGGTSGSSCVGAVLVQGGTYADITEAPAGAVYEYDQSYNASCLMVEDGTGLPGSPDLALTGWWGYTTCVTTTAIPAVIQLADDRVLKLVIESYYEADQALCNADGTPGINSGVLTARWQFLN